MHKIGLMKIAINFIVLTNCSVIFSNCKQSDVDMLSHDEIVNRVEGVWLL